MDTAMKVVTASANSLLDKLFESICESVQLTDEQFQEAQRHYQAVGRYLAQEDSPLAIFRPEIYPQGSVRLRTTVKPLTRQEHDLDLICHLNLPYGTYLGPKDVFALIEGWLRENGHYRGKLEQYKRCIRINYKSEFHLDITPARRDWLRDHDCLLVPDRKIRGWKESNPVGYARWFDGKAFMTKTARYARAIEALPEQESARQKAPLRRAVQLMKRNRDWAFDGDPDAPRSIVLTTLAAENYGGEELVSDALIGILDGIIERIEETPGVLEVPNPANPPEKFCEAWIGNRAAYNKFTGYIYNLRDSISTLIPLTGMESIAKGLNGLFGEKVTRRAVANYTEKFERDRQSRIIHFGKTNVGLSSVAAAQSDARPVPRNTFYGD